MRAGAPKPDIGTVDAFKRSLLEAELIADSDGPSGAYIADLLYRLGIAREMKPKTKLTSRPVAELVAAGEAEIGMQQIVAILPVKGAELVGPLPSELQNVIIYAAGLAACVPDPAAARGFIDFMRTAEAVRLIRAKGMEPVLSVYRLMSQMCCAIAFMPIWSTRAVAPIHTAHFTAGGELRPSERPCRVPL